MPLRIEQFPVLDDNYGYLVRDEASGKVACIDTPDAETISAALKRLGWGLDLILNTHWHPRPRRRQRSSAKAVRGGHLRTAGGHPHRAARSSGDGGRQGPPRRHRVRGDRRRRPHPAAHRLSRRRGCGGLRRRQHLPPRLRADVRGRSRADVERPATHRRPCPTRPDSIAPMNTPPPTPGSPCRWDDAPALKARAEAVFAARERAEWTVPSTVGEGRPPTPSCARPCWRLAWAWQASGPGGLRRRAQGQG